MAGHQREKAVQDEVRQNQFLREQYLRELRMQKLYTEYHVNPLRKVHTITRKPMSWHDNLEEPADGQPGAPGPQAEPLQGLQGHHSVQGQTVAPGGGGPPQVAPAVQSAFTLRARVCASRGINIVLLRNKTVASLMTTELKWNCILISTWGITFKILHKCCINLIWGPLN